MRFHRRYSLLQCWVQNPQSRELMNPDALCIARFEPAFAGASGVTVLDLTFARDERVAVIPNLEVSAEMLLEREKSPLIWPEACRQLPVEMLGQMEERLVPWLTSLVLARQANAEVVRRFSGCISNEEWESARSAAFLGASRYMNATLAMAPYVYAARFAARSVAVRDPLGASGAAFLRAHAESVDADLGTPERNTLANRWFGSDIFAEVSDSHADLGIWARDSAPLSACTGISLDAAKHATRAVAVAQPVPTCVMFSFDPEDSNLARSFGVHLREPARAREWSAPRQIPAAAGSSGSILLLVHDAWQREGGADVDEARALQNRLKREGFSARIASSSQLAAGDAFDLVHAFSLRRAAEFAPVLQRFRSAGTPVVLSAATARRTQEIAWGPSMVRAIFTQQRDESALQDFLKLLETRRINDGANLPENAEPCAGYTAAVAAALAAADTIITAGPQEEVYLREAYGFRGPISHAAPYAPEIQSHDVSALAGRNDFVLVHAPVDWNGALPMLVRAAVSQKMRVIAAGAVVDADPLRIARELGGEYFFHVPALDEAEMAGLYLRARVFADVSWSASGLSRIARAVNSGCRVLASTFSRAPELWPDAVEADPASVNSLSAGLLRAWDAAVPAPAAPGEAFLAVVQAYAQAQRVRAPA